MKNISETKTTDTISNGILRGKSRTTKRSRLLKLFVFVFTLALSMSNIMTLKPVEAAYGAPTANYTIDISTIGTTSGSVAPYVTFNSSNQLTFGATSSGRVYKLTTSTSTTNRRIIVQDGVKVTLILSGVNMSHGSLSAFELEGSAEVVVWLTDGSKNSFECKSTELSTTKKAGITAPRGTKLSIIGDYSNYSTNPDGLGTGTLYVKGGVGGTGIGGGYGTSSYSSEAGGEIRINHSKIEAIGGEYCAGIDGTITVIDNSEIIARGGPNGGAGIGNGLHRNYNGKENVITISNSKITAVGGTSDEAEMGYSGIGGSMDIGLGEITLINSNVNATALSLNGAGIGGMVSNSSSAAGKITIINCNIVARSGAGAAAIGHSRQVTDIKENSIIITIKDSTIDAVAGEIRPSLEDYSYRLGGAGIGGGSRNSGGVIIIQNSHVKAKGCNGAAGIGGSYSQGAAEYLTGGGSAGTIEITDSEIIAEGGKDSDAGGVVGFGIGGAGIGGAYINREGGKITINNSTVTAKGFNGAAGIGGGTGGSNGEVTLNNSSVYAIATEGNAAGIGGGGGASGYRSNCNGGNITITGGNVIAIGGPSKGAGIGGGEALNSFDSQLSAVVTINSTAIVKAYSAGGKSAIDASNLSGNGHFINAYFYNTTDLASNSDFTEIEVFNTSGNPLKDSKGNNIVLSLPRNYSKFAFTTNSTTPVTTNMIIKAVKTNEIVNAYNLTSEINTNYSTADAYNISSNNSNQAVQVWLRGPRILYYDKNGGDSSPSSVNISQPGEYTLTSTKPTHANYDNKKVMFLGWTETIDTHIYKVGELSSLPKTITTIYIEKINRTVYALWGYDVNNNSKADVYEHELIYNVNGGNNDGPVNEIISYGMINRTLSTVMPTHANSNGKKVVFAGWTRTADTHIYDISELSSMPQLIKWVSIEDTDIVVYALWGYDTNNNGKADVNEYLLTYDVNGGNPGVPANEIISQLVNNHPLSSVVPTHANSDGKKVVFAGWTLVADTHIYGLGESNSLPATVTTVNVTSNGAKVYALWGYDANNNGIPDVNEYLLTYDVNGGNPGAPANEIISQLVNNHPLSSVIPTHANSDGKKVVFLGWTEMIDTHIYGLGESNSLPTTVTTVNINSNGAKVYALWGYDANNNDIPDVNEYLLTYDVNGGNPGVPANEILSQFGINYPLSSVIPTHASIEGKKVVFLGWTEIIDTHIYGLGESNSLPTTVTTVDIPSSGKTVYALWGYDANENGVADAYEAEYRVDYYYDEIIDDSSTYFGIGLIGDSLSAAYFPNLLKPGYVFDRIELSSSILSSQKDKNIISVYYKKDGEGDDGDPIPATDFTLNVKNKTVAVFDSFPLEITLLPEGSTGIPKYKSNNKKVAVIVGSGTSVKVYGLKKGATTISVTVKGKTKKVNVKVKNRKPTIKAIAVDYDKVEIKFTKQLSEASGYKLQRSTKKYSGFKTIEKLPVDTTNVIDDNVKTGKTYYYRVRAYITLNGVTYYSPYSTVKKAKPTLVAPSSLTCIAPGNSTLTVTASEVDGADGYQFRYDTKAKGTFSTVKTVSTDNATFKILEGGKNYYVKARAYRLVSGKKVYGKYSKVTKVFVPLATPDIGVSNMSDQDGLIEMGDVVSDSNWVQFSIKNQGKLPLVIKNSIGWSLATDLPELPVANDEIQLADSKNKNQSSLTIEPGKTVKVRFKYDFSTMKWNDVFSVAVKYEGKKYLLGIQFDTYLDFQTLSVTDVEPEDLIVVPVETTETEEVEDDEIIVDIE